MTPASDIAIAHPEDAPVLVPLHSRRAQRARRAQHLQHLVPAGTLLVAGVQGLQGGVEGVELLLALLEVGTSLILAISIVRSFRRKHGHRHGPHQGHHGEGSRIAWIDIFAAAVIFTEAFEKWVTHHHIARPVILLGFVTLGLGFGHGWIEQRIHQRRALRLTGEGLTIGGRKFRPAFRARWKEIAVIEIEAHEARIVTNSGKTRRIDLADLENAGEVVTALREAQGRVPPALPQ